MRLKLIEHAELWLGRLVGFGYGNDYLIPLDACRKGCNRTHGGCSQASAISKVELGAMQGASDNVTITGARVKHRPSVAASILDRMKLAINAAHQHIHAIKVAHHKAIVTKLGDRNR